MTRHRHRLLNRKWLFILSLFLLIRALALVACIIFFVLGAYHQEPFPLYIAGGCLALLLLLQMIHSMENSKIVCPNCRSQLLVSRRCSKHKEAKKLFGSYTLRLAIHVIFSNSFRCHFCNQRYQWRGEKPGKPEGT